MIKIKKLLTILLLITISITACKSSENSENRIFNQIIKDKIDIDSKYNNSIINNNNQISDNNLTKTPSSLFELEQLGPIGITHRSYDEIRKKYPDKVILTVTGIIPSDFITDKVNDYLVQNGTNYVIYFFELKKEYSKAFIAINENNKEQYEEKKDVVYNLLNMVDIISVDRKMYYEFAHKGYFESFNEYFSTDEGKELYKSLPLNNWKTCLIDDKIYGINGRADLVFGPPSYIVNKDIMIKYGFTIEDLNKPIYELEEIINKVAKNEVDNVVFKPIVIDYAEWFNVFDNAVYLNSKAVALFNDLAKNAGSVLDDTENLRWLEALCNYANQDLVGKVNERLSNFFIKVNIRSSLPYLIPDGMFLYNKEGKPVSEQDVTEIVLDKYYKGSLCWINLTSRYADCIPVYANNKNEAFDFITRVYTDPYLTNLFTYGIENKTFIMENEKVVWPDMNYLGYGNAYISYPRNYEYNDKKERYWKLNDELSYVYYDFIFDPTNVQNELEKTNQIMGSVSSNILSGKLQNFDIYINDIKKQLNDNGLKKLLDEINRQRNDWMKSKSQ